MYVNSKTLEKIYRTVVEITQKSLIRNLNEGEGKECGKWSVFQLQSNETIFINWSL